jgi:hypothetical protein
MPLCRISPFPLTLSPQQLISSAVSRSKTRVADVGSSRWRLVVSYTDVDTSQTAIAG